MRKSTVPTGYYLFSFLSLSPFDRRCIEVVASCCMQIDVFEQFPILMQYLVWLLVHFESLPIHQSL